MKSLFLALTLVACAGNAECGLAPRWFVSAAADPIYPVNDYILAGGIEVERVRLFFAYHNLNHDTDVDDTGYYWGGMEKLLGGATWMLASREARMIPSIGGGISIGRDKAEYYYNETFPIPGDPYHYRLSRARLDTQTALGIFAEFGLNFPVPHTGVILTAMMHNDLSWSDYDATAYEFQTEANVINLVWGLLLGASYRF